MAFRNIFGAKPKSLGDAVAAPPHDVERPQRISTLVTRWTCACTEVWTRSAETIEAVCSLCGDPFERASNLSVAEAHRHKSDLAERS